MNSFEVSNFKKHETDGSEQLQENDERISSKITSIESIQEQKTRDDVIDKCDEDDEGACTFGKDSIYIQIEICLEASNNVVQRTFEKILHLENVYGTERFLGVVFVDENGVGVHTLVDPNVFHF